MDEKKSNKNAKECTDFEENSKNVKSDNTKHNSSKKNRDPKIRKNYRTIDEL